MHLLVLAVFEKYFINISVLCGELSGFETWKIGHTRINTHTSGRQLKIKFLDVLDYSEYFDTNISNFFFSRKHSFLNEKVKTSLFSIKIAAIILVHYVRF